MASDRLSMNTDAARAAALQAEFNEKTWVWVPDAREGYLAGWVKKDGEEAEQTRVSSAQLPIDTSPPASLGKHAPDNSLGRWSVKDHQANLGPVISQDLGEPASKEELRKRAEELNS